VLVHNTNPGKRSAIAYEVHFDVNDIRTGPNGKPRIRVAPRQPNKTPMSLDAIRNAMGAGDTLGPRSYYYSGKASMPDEGHVMSEKQIFEQRYSKWGKKCKKWVNIPGTNMQMEIDIGFDDRLPNNVRKVKTTAPFRGDGRGVTINGNFYQTEELQARGAEQRIHEKNGAFSGNPNRPISTTNPMRTEALNHADALADCYRRGLFP